MCMVMDQETIVTDQNRQPDHRLQMLLPAASKARLDKLVEKTEAASYAEVMRNALRLYEVAVEEAEKGGGLFMLKDGAHVPVITI